MRKATEHYEASRVNIMSHGDSSVVGALRELRDRRAASGEDMGVAVGAYAYPFGHKNGRCVERWRHLGEGQWVHDLDLHYTHDPSHSASSRPVQRTGGEASTGRTDEEAGEQ